MRQKVQLLPMLAAVAAISGPLSDYSFANSSREVPTALPQPPRASVRGVEVPGVATPNVIAAATRLNSKVQVLRAGDRGKEVEDLQLALKIPVNGKYDLATENAVKKFQGQENLKADGRAGPQVLYVLQQRLRGEPINQAELELRGLCCETFRERTKIVRESKFTVPIDRTAGRLRGNSRNHGDASPEVQTRCMRQIILRARECGLRVDDIAMALAIASVESGFNPDAAAKSSSAANLFQCIEETGQRIWKKDLRQTTELNTFDVDAGIDLGLALMQKYCSRDRSLRGENRCIALYEQHHTGAVAGEIARSKVVPLYKDFAALLSVHQEALLPKPPADEFRVADLNARR